MQNLHEIGQAKQPWDREKILAAAAAAIADGKRPGEANLADGRSSVERAADYTESYGKISDEAVDLTVAEEKQVNLRNLTKAQEKIEAGEVTQEVPAAALNVDGPSC